MINCPLKELQTIYLKLQKLVLTVRPGNGQFLRQPSPQNLVEVIHSYVQNLYESLVNINERTHNQTNGDAQMYQQIEKDLQKQQNLNRLLIKKELEFKEYQKCLEEELKEERTTAKKLQSKLEKFNEKMVSRDMQILHLSNQKKMFAKQKRVKDFLTMDTLLNDKKLNEGLKAMSKQLGSATKPTHSRRRSDDVCKRPSTANSKKQRGSVSKR